MPCEALEEGWVGCGEGLLPGFGGCGAVDYTVEDGRGHQGAYGDGLMLVGD